MKINIYILLILASFLSLVSCDKQKTNNHSETTTKGNSSANNSSVPSPAPEGQNEKPFLNIYTLEGNKVSIKYQKGKVVLVMFQPDCDDCQREATQISENIEAFNDYQLYFVTTASMEEIKNFSKDYKLDGHKNVVFGQTNLQNVLNTIGPIHAPSVFVYSDEGKLVKHFNGEVDIKEIKAVL